MLPDCSVVEVLADGSERPLPDTPMRPMTPEEVEEAARAYPDARPMTAEQLAKARRIPRIKTLRRALGLTQEEFAARYKIPLVLRISQMFHLRSDRYRRSGDPQADELNQVTESEH